MKKFRKIGIGFYPGILFGIRSYEESVIFIEHDYSEISPDAEPTAVSHLVFYIPFIELVITTHYES